MKKRNIAVVITARPSYSRVKTLVAAIDKHPDLNLQLIVAASALSARYGSAIDYIQSDGFEVTSKVYNLLEGENLISAAKTTGMGILELSTVFDNLRPDIVVTVADRYETMATAIAASYMNIPLAHIQGGEVTGNIDEKVRHSITKLSDYHFVSSEKAKERVLKLGEEEAFVFNTGCPSIDLAVGIEPETPLGYDIYEKYGGVGAEVDISGKFVVVMQHPVTTEYEQARQQISTTLEAVRELDVPTLWFWPNVDAGSDGTSKGLRTFRETHESIKFHFFKHVDSQDFLRLINRCSALIGNSSAGIREAAFLGVPVVNIGSRQNGRDRGANVRDVVYDQQLITQAAQQQIDHGKYQSDHLYGDGQSGERIAQHLAEVELRFHKTLTY